MELNRNAIAMLLALDDTQLKFIINRLAVNMGIDTEYFGLKQQDVSVIRRRLSELTDADIAEAKRQMDAKNRGSNG